MTNRNVWLLDKDIKVSHYNKCVLVGDIDWITSHSTGKLFAKKSIKKKWNEINIVKESNFSVPDFREDSDKWKLMDGKTRHRIVGFLFLFPYAAWLFFYLFTIRFAGPWQHSCLSLKLHAVKYVPSWLTKNDRFSLSILG